jgi:hypothetical protein
VLATLGSYDLTYGSLAGVMIALIFFFLSGSAWLSAPNSTRLWRKPRDGLEEPAQKGGAKFSVTGLMQGKRGLIMGLANDRSLAWGIAQKLAKQGAELAFSYQGEALEKRVRPLAEQLGATS